MGTFRAEERNVPGGEERGETDVFAGYTKPRASFATSNPDLNHIKSWPKNMIKPILLYGSEKWKWTSSQQQGLDRTYTNLLRHVQNMHWSEHASREQIYGKLPPFVQKLTKCRLQLNAQTSTALQRKSQKRISRQALVCLPFIGGNSFSPTADNQTFSVFVSKVQNEQGILSFVHRKLSWES